MSKYYRLNDAGEPEVEIDLMTWANDFQRADRSVAQTMVNGAKVSTVFLGLDHQFDPDGPPLVFETLVFGGAHDQEMERYTTREEALAGHARMVRLIQDTTFP